MGWVVFAQHVVRREHFEFLFKVEKGSNDVRRAADLSADLPTGHNVGFVVVGDALAAGAGGGFIVFDIDAAIVGVEVSFLIRPVDEHVCFFAKVRFAR